MPRLAAFALLSASLTLAAEPAKKGPANRLAKESSPYLLQHAHNPVNWYPWGLEAFAKAKAEKKLIFLSVGYSACHWCHVMERESFEDAGVAEILNKNFICIKVDREERPDVDEIYMASLNVIGSRGGWPMSMFLTSEGKPIVGGTYWPKEDREVEGQTVRGFKSVLKYIIDLNVTRHDELEKQADAIAERTRDALNRSARGLALVELDEKLIKDVAEAIREDLDPLHGGIGNAAAKFRGTKFPNVTTMRFLLAYAVRYQDDDLKKLAELALDKMAEGGIYDQLGGGFHRYSTERTWTVPHFEKMLYDQSQMIELYLDGLKVFGKPMYERVVRETIAFVQRELAAPGGGFYSALDADTDGKEGEYYLWTGEQIDKILTDTKDSTLFKAVFGGAFNPNFENKQWVLRWQRSAEEIAKDQKTTVPQLLDRLQELRAKMLKARDGRETPFRDTKVLAGWNGQMIAALARAGRELKDESYITAAKKAADFVLGSMRDGEGRLLRSYASAEGGKPEARGPGYLDDHAFVGRGLWLLAQAGGGEKYAADAKKLADVILKDFGEDDRGGFFTTGPRHEKLFARTKDLADGAQPAGNTAAVELFLMLAGGDAKSPYRARAEQTLKQHAGAMKSIPSAVPGEAENLMRFLAK